MTIQSLFEKYQGKIDFLDLELIIAHGINKSREFVLTHPEYELVKSEKLKVKSYLLRRMKHEPLAYIIGEKEFYGIKFKVNKNTLIPRPETEMMVDLVLKKIQNTKIIDVGTGSGNIIIALAKNLLNHEPASPAGGSRIINYAFYGIDIDTKAISVAKNNAKLNKVDKKIKFIKGNLLNPIIQNSKFKIQNSNLTITANLPYLSKEIYNSCSKDIKNYEPKSALLSQKEGLSHYEKLLRQLVTGYWSLVTCFFEISPEQKPKIFKLIKSYFPKAKIIFHKDLSGRWRICETEFQI